MEFKNKNLRFHLKTCKNILKKKNLKLNLNTFNKVTYKVTIKAQSKKYFEKSPNFCH